MNTLLRHLLVLTSALVATQPVAAQDAIPRGAELRVTAPSLGIVRHRGQLEEWTDDLIRIDGLVVDRDAITELEVGREVSNFFRFAGIGLLTGAALGAAVCLNECPSGDSDISKGGYMFLYTSVAGGGGLVLGALVGALTHRTQWRSVLGGGPSPSLGVAPDGRLLLGVRIPM